MIEPTLWVEKYRPKTIDECILPGDLKNTFRGMVKSGITNLMLCGGPGVGKTSVIKAMMNEVGSDYLFLNGSLNVNIDKIRNDITEFASSVSFAGGRKFVIIDEADNLSSTVQVSLRSFIEQFSNNCGFIFTCNYKQKIIEPLHSRFSVIDFKITKSQKQELAGEFFKKLLVILKNENVEFDKKVIGEVLLKWYPDNRRILNELQRYSKNGRIDTGILVNFSESNYKSLLGFIKEKNFTSIRKWVGEQSDHSNFYSDFFKFIEGHTTPVSLSQAILILGKYGYQHNLCVDQEINVCACIVELMLDVEFT